MAEVSGCCGHGARQACSTLFAVLLAAAMLRPAGNKHWRLCCGAFLCGGGVVSVTLLSGGVGAVTLLIGGVVTVTLVSGGVVTLTLFVVAFSKVE